jgi:hypothetical protein
MLKYWVFWAQLCEEYADWQFASVGPVMPVIPAFVNMCVVNSYNPEGPAIKPLPKPLLEPPPNPPIKGIFSPPMQI